MTAFAALTALMLAAAASSAGAASPARAPIGGLVPHAGHSAAKGAGANVFLQHPPCSLGSLFPCWVMRTNTTYAVYWVPSGYSVETGYEADIDRYLSDVAAASGSQTNVFSVATQYYDATGFVDYRSTFGGSFVDTDPFPTSGCDDTFQGVQDPVCLTDRQLQTEIQRVIAARGWKDGRNALFFILTPKSVGSCISGECTTNSFCAYHSDFSGASGEPILYANIPYAKDIDGCARGPSPNGDDADATINTMSHEQNEAITDPVGDAWRNTDGDEIADICAWQFGTPLGTASNGQAYNQLINGHPYALQEVYSNDGSRCRQRYVGRPALTARPTLVGVARQGHVLSASRGSWRQLPTHYAYHWLRCRVTGGRCAAIRGARSATYRIVSADTGHRLEARVTAKNSGGTTNAATKGSAVVVGVPASRKRPQISGPAQVGGRLAAGKGSWSGPPKTYRFQWLRCDASGGSCVEIEHATHPRYRPTEPDARHRLRVRVTARNAAGSKTAMSPATVPVSAKP